MDEADVWKKIEKLNEMYEDAVLAERSRYELLLEQRIRELSDEANADSREMRAGNGEI